MALLAIIYILIFIIFALCAYAVMQIKLAGIDVKDFWKEYIGNIKPFYLEQKKDDDVIISASPEFLLKPVCERLKIKNLIASKVNMQSGKYTGVNCHGKEKVKRFYEAFPNGKIDSFYSDSYSDSPLAEIADKAFMVDGDKIESWIFIK